MSDDRLLATSLSSAGSSRGHRWRVIDDVTILSLGVAMLAMSVMSSGRSLWLWGGSGLIAAMSLSGST